MKRLLFFLLLVECAWSQEFVQNADVKAVAQQDGLCLYRGAAEHPFAKMLLPPDMKRATNAVAGELVYQTEECVLKVSAHACLPFIQFSLAPRPGATSRVVKTLALPEIRLAETLAPAECKALGTAGLTAVDGHPGSYMFLAVAKPDTRRGVVAAWLTSLRASGIVFSSLTADKKAVSIHAESQYGRYEVDAGNATPEGETFVIGTFGDCLHGLEQYADAVAMRFNIHMMPQIAGYCTWYADKNGGCGSEASTREFADVAAQKLTPYGFRFFQIDDKWQDGNSKNGPKKNFTRHNPQGAYPSGMKATADYLKGKGIRPGIWFMPFSGNFDDPWYADKQEWFVKSAIDYPPAGQKNTRLYNTINQKKGAPYETFWGGTSLDMTDHDVAAYMLREVTQISHDWGYKYFKFDGMWTAMACEQIYVNDGYRPDDLGEQVFDNPKTTNVENFRTGLQRVRDAAGADVFILGCNVSQNMRTMGAAYGLVNAMRIGPDNGPSWQGVCSGPVRGTARYFFNGRVWYNDPDPVYVRDSIPLSRARLIASWVSLSGALYAFSDWLPGLSAERVAVLQKTMAPHRCLNVRPLDLFESPLANIWKLAKKEHIIFGLYNWDEKKPLKIERSAASLGLDPESTYAAFDFWGDAFLPHMKGSFAAELPGGECKVVSVRKLEDAPVLISTSRHVASPAFEVTEETWDAASKTLSGVSETVAGDPYELRIALPQGFAFQSASAENTEKLLPKADGSNLRVSFVPGKTGKTVWKIVFRK